MGRGRAKAKQTRVARELKYRSVSTDFGSLARELRSGDPYEVIPDAYADMADAYEPEDDLEEEEYEPGSYSEDDDEDDDLGANQRKSG